MDLVKIDETKNVVMPVKPKVKAFQKPDFDLYKYLDYCSDDTKLLTYGPIVLDYLYKEKEYYENLNVAYQSQDIEQLEHRIQCRKITEQLENEIKSKKDADEFNVKIKEMEDKYYAERLEKRNLRRAEILKMKYLIDKEEDNVVIDDTYFDILDPDDLKGKDLKEIQNILKKYKNLYTFFEEIEKRYSGYLNCNSEKHPLEFEYLHNNPDERNLYLDCFYSNADNKDIPYKITAYKYKKELKPLLDELEKIYEQKSKQARNKHMAYVLEHNKEKKMCVCGVEVTNGNMPRHTKTKRHLDYISKNN